ncbi:hypothetical protein ACFL5Z_10155 [Planctomycetota bacterium]
MDDKIIGALIALGGTLAGVTVSAIYGYFHILSASRATYVDAVRYMEKGSQRRSIGISLLAESIRSRRFSRQSISILIGAGIYLLTGSEQGTAQHELHNLDRIFDLIEEYGKKAKKGELNTLSAALKKRGGLDISEGDRVARYEKILRKFA